MKIGYVPYSSSLDMPGDRRRFVFYAETKGLTFEIADPSKKYDVVVLSERADLSVWSRYRHAKIVFDLIDSYLAIPQSDVRGLLRGVSKFAFRQTKYLHFNYKKLIQRMCAQAAAVICTTQEQAAEIGALCSNTHIVLDAHRMVLQDAAKTNYQANQPFRIVWEGLPHTLASLGVIDATIAKLAQTQSIEWHIVTDPVSFRFLGSHGKVKTEKILAKYKSRMIFHRWNEDTVAAIIKSCDLAVIPLNMNDPFSMGKPENKLLLFWRMGMPVVTSATPAYRRAMMKAGVDMYCVSDSEWATKLTECIKNEEYRKAMAMKGEAIAREQYSEQATLLAWDEVFRSIAER
jgi:glycosyltransferase involved in cell wall biosynthesis